MHRKRPGLPAQFLASIIVWSILAPAFGNGNHVIFDDKSIEATGEVTGFPSHQNHDTKRPGNDAVLVGIGGAEQGDKPCYMEFTWSRQNDTEHRTFVTKWYENPCDGDQGSDGSFEQTRLVQRDATVGISAIRVCNNDKSNKRLKAVEITAARAVAESGTTSTQLALEDEKYLRPHCASWDNASSCDAGKVAMGVNVYHDSEGATGLELICATPRLESELVTGPVTEPLPQGTQHKSGLSGASGETARVMIGTNVILPNDPLRHYGITAIMLAETSDRPCAIKVFGGVLDPAKQPRDRLLAKFELDRCGGGPPWADTTFPTLTDRSDQFLVGVEVCDSKNRNNNRIKGLKLFAGTISDTGFVSLQPSSPDIQPNCGIRADRVFCEDRFGGSSYSVAVGLVLHHSDDAFTGIELVCRDVTIGEYPALKSDSLGY